MDDLLNSWDGARRPLPGSARNTRLPGLSSLSRRWSRPCLARLAALRWVRPLLSGGRRHTRDARASCDPPASAGLISRPLLSHACLPVAIRTVYSYIQVRESKREGSGQDDYLGLKTGNLAGYHRSGHFQTCFPGNDAVYGNVPVVAPLSSPKCFSVRYIQQSRPASNEQIVGC